MSIDNYLADLEDVQDRYNRNWRNPISTIYANAHERFHETLNAQAKAETAAADLILLFTSVGFGGAMTALFGKAALNTVIAQGAIKQLAQRNLGRVGTAAQSVLTNAPIAYIAGESWKGLAKTVQTQSKGHIASLVTKPVVREGIRNPLAFKNDLDNWVLDCKNAAYALGRSVRDSAELNDAERSAFAEGFRNAPFFKYAPTLPVIKEIQKATDLVELMFYMVVVMNSDYLVETTIGHSGAHDYSRTRTLGSVSERASGPNYPKESHQHSRGLGYSRDTLKYVDYRRPGHIFFFGSEIMDRANHLHKTYFGTKFEQGSYGRDEIQRAEQLSLVIRHLVPGL